MRTYLKAVIRNLKIEKEPQIEWVRANKIRKGDFIPGFGIVSENNNGHVRFNGETESYGNGYHYNSLVEVWR